MSWGYVLWAVAALVIAGAFGGLAAWLDANGGSDGALVICVIIALLAAVGALMVALVPNLNRVSCQETTTAMDREGAYGVWTGCLVQLSDGRWVPLDTYRLNDNEAER